MTERALSETSMLASLRDIDLPVAAAGGTAAEIAMTVGLAGLSALILAGGLRIISLRRTAAPVRTLRDDLAAARRLPEADRRVKLLHLLRNRAPERYGQIARDLYRGETTVPVDLLEAELERLV